MTPSTFFLLLLNCIRLDPLHMFCSRPHRLPRSAPLLVLSSIGLPRTSPTGANSVACSGTTVLPRVSKHSSRQ